MLTAALVTGADAPAARHRPASNPRSRILAPQPARSATAIETQPDDPDTPEPGTPEASGDEAHPQPPLTLRRALIRIGIVVVIAVTVLLAGAVNGVGPLARTTPASEVTEPAEQLARSMQSVIDASSVRIGASVLGKVPGALVGRSEPSVTLDGTMATLDLRPQDARTHLVFGSLPLSLNVEAITSWDTMAYKINDGPWTKGSLASVVAGTGIDANPLTLVDRIRKWLAEPGAPVPTTTDVPCDAPSGACRQVVVSLGAEAGSIVLKAFPNSSSVKVGATTTDLVLLTDATTLRPAHLVLASRSADGSVAVTVQLDFSLWDWPSVIPDPPGA